MKTKAESFRVLRIPKFVTDQSASRDSNELSSESLTDFPDRGFGTVKKVDSLRSYNSIFGPKNTPKKIGDVTSVQTGKFLLKNASMLISTRANTLDSTGIDDALKERPSLNTPSKQYFKITKNLKFNYLNPNGPLKVGLVKKETTQSTSALELPILSSKRDNLQSKSTKSPQSDRTPPPYLDYFPNIPSPTRPSAQPDYYLHGLYRHSQWHPSSASPKNPFSKYFDHMHETRTVLSTLRSDGPTNTPSAFTKNLFGHVPRGRPLLVLDLDETLIHCCNGDMEKTDPAHTQSVKFYTESGIQVTAKIVVRPHLKEFLTAVSEHWDVVVYTASEREYAHAIVRLIDPNRQYIKQIFHRDHCVVTKMGYIVKDLRTVAGDDLQRVVLVDNSAHCFALQISNGVPIIPFTNDMEDRELLQLANFCSVLKGNINFPRYLDDYFCLRKFADYKSSDELLNRLISCYKRRKIF